MKVITVLLGWGPRTFNKGLIKITDIYFVLLKVFIPKGLAL